MVGENGGNAVACIGIGRIFGLSVVDFQIRNVNSNLAITGKVYAIFINTGNFFLSFFINVREGALCSDLRNFAVGYEDIAIFPNVTVVCAKDSGSSSLREQSGVVILLSDKGECV